MPEQDLQNQIFHNQIDEFIDTQIAGKGLDERTVKAYRIDLEHFYMWMEQAEAGDCLSSTACGYTGYEEWMEAYLCYLLEEKKLRFSTVSRKQKVFHYYLSYLTKKGVMEEYCPLHRMIPSGRLKGKEETEDIYLTKKEIDAFFQAIRQEYEELDSDFRRRVCLRDRVMMELLFYHQIEVSELLRMEVSDYNHKTAVLSVHRKKEKERQIHLFSRALQGRMEQWLEEHDYFEHGGACDSRMFLSKLGKPLSMKMVINIFGKYRAKAKITKECTPKDLKNGLGRYAMELMREREAKDDAERWGI